MHVLVGQDVTCKFNAATRTMKYCLQPARISRQLTCRSRHCPPDNLGRRRAELDPHRNLTPGGAASDLEAGQV